MSLLLCRWSVLSSIFRTRMSNGRRDKKEREIDVWMESRERARAESGHCFWHAGASLRIRVLRWNHPQPPASGLETHTFTRKHTWMKLYRQYKPVMVGAVACVTGCDSILSHCNAPGFDSEEQQWGTSAKILFPWKGKRNISNTPAYSGRTLVIIFSFLSFTDWSVVKKV